MWSAKQLQLQGDPTLLRPPPSAFGAPLAPTWELLQVNYEYRDLPTPRVLLSNEYIYRFNNEHIFM